PSRADANLTCMLTLLSTSSHPSSTILHFYPLPTRRSSDLDPVVGRDPDRHRLFLGPSGAHRGEDLQRVAHPVLKAAAVFIFADVDRKSTRLNSSHVKISYAVFCLKKKNN